MEKWFLPAILLAAACSQPPGQKKEPFPEWALLPFKKANDFNPVLGPGNGIFADPIRHEPVYWEKKDVFNPAVVAVKRAGMICLLYRAQDSIGRPAGTSRIGLAMSADGFHFVRKREPVLYPDEDDQKKYEWQGGCEDPRVVEDGDGMYYMTYTAFDGKTARLMIASSGDLIHWKKHGPAFARAFGGKYLDAWSKSGSIVSKYEDGRIVATRIQGKYWMYWGDQYIWAAVSDDLVNWTPVQKSPGAPGGKDMVPLRGIAAKMPELAVVVSTRTGYFDSDLVESGPPAMLTDQGILLIYNSRNIPSIGDTTLAEGTYAASQVLLDKSDPTKVIDRLDHYFLAPDKPWEAQGQVSRVCFVEGLAWYNGVWLLYYGTADSKIAVALSTKRKPG